MTSPWRGLRRRLSKPVVSVVIPVYNVEEYLDECLDSLLAQSLSDLEVIAVDDGSTDRSAAILQRHAARDRRLRVITQPNAGQGAARNAGVSIARGEFLMFVDADDVVPRDALAVMVSTLRHTGSDFVLGAAQRFTHRRNHEIAWGRLVHDRDRLSTSLDAFPDAILDIIACNRLFRADFWRTRVPPFETGMAYEDHVPMLAASVRASRFDVLARVVYRWRIRTDGSSTSQQKATLRNLADRIAVKEQARLLLGAEASPLVYDAWVARTIDIDYQPFLRHALSAEPAYRELLGRALAAILEGASDRALDRMRYSPKVRAWLASRRDWTGLDEAEAWFGEHGHLPRGRVQGERLVADDDGAPPFLEEVPERMRGLAEHETPMSAVITSARWAGARLSLEGYVLVRGLDAATRAPSVEARLVGDSPDDPVPLPVTIHPDDRVDVWAGDASVSYRHGRFATQVDLDTLGEGSWRLVLQVSRGDLVREDGVHRVLDGSAVPRLGEHAVGSRAAAATLAPEGFAIEIRNGRPAARPRAGQRLDVEAIALDGTRLTLGLGACDLDERQLGTAMLEGDGLTLSAVSADSTRIVFDLTTTRWDLGATVVPHGGYRLLADGVAAEPGETLLPLLPSPQVSADVRVTARMRPTGVLGLNVAAPLSDTERSPVGRLQLEGLPATTVDPDLVLLQCGDGDSADGDPLALDAALARTRPHLRRVWAVRTREVLLPEDAQSVVIGTTAWHETLRGAGTIISDGEIADWYERAPEQRWIVTGTGHPAKAMGSAHDRILGLSPGRSAARAERRNRAWSVLLAGSSDAEQLYRAALGFDGRILTTGLPRTDLLLPAPAADETRRQQRAAARARLGAGPDQTLVLYAPTYRDPQVDRVRSAPLPRLLGLAAIQRIPGARVLLRAHPYDAPDAAAWARETGALDVTGYPHQADLLLAADVAVLDHSALRFDWALTGKPAICFVPDQAAYEARRPQLLPYEQTAPGPVVTRGEEVVRLLSDLPTLRAASAPRAAAVRRRFGSLADGSAADRVVADLF